MNNEQTTLITNAVIAITTGVIVAIGQWFSNRRRDKQTKRDEEQAKTDHASEFSHQFKHDTAVDNEIVDEMSEYIALTGADRIQVFAYHNGSYFATGRPIRKMSCVYEVTKRGVIGMQPELQNMPTFLMPRFFEKILTDKMLEVFEIDDIKECKPLTWEIKTRQGIKSFYDIGLQDEQGHDIGLLAVQWIKTAGRLNKEQKAEVDRLKWFVEQRIGGNK